MKTKEKAPDEKTLRIINFLETKQEQIIQETKTLKEMIEKSEIAIENKLFFNLKDFVVNLSKNYDNEIQAKNFLLSMGLKNLTSDAGINFLKEICNLPYKNNLFY
jgi:hypothetical protein